MHAGILRFENKRFGNNCLLCKEYMYNDHCLCEGHLRQRCITHSRVKGTCMVSHSSYSKCLYSSKTTYRFKFRVDTFVVEVRISNCIV